MPGVDGHQQRRQLTSLPVNQFFGQKIHSRDGQNAEDGIRQADSKFRQTENFDRWDGEESIQRQFVISKRAQVGEKQLPPGGAPLVPASLKQ